MIPRSILRYLDKHGVLFSRHPHPRAISAQEVAASIHVTGYRVAKTVVAQAEGRRFIVVLPAAEMLDLPQFATAVGATEASLVDEGEFDALFPDCELGAEPPFGGLYGLPVVLDERLTRDDTLVLRAGSHEETLEMQLADFVRLERPLVAAIGLPFGALAARTSLDTRPTP